MNAGNIEESPLSQYSTNQICINKEDGSKLTRNLCQRETGMKEMIETICRGNPIVPFWLKDYQKNRSLSNWQSSNLVMLDFDGEMRLEEAKREFNKIALFIYTTVSHGHNGKDRFRVVMRLPYIVKDVQLMKQILVALLTLYPADKACKDYSHGYFGNTNAQICSFLASNVLDIQRVFIDAEIKNSRRIKRLVSSTPRSGENGAQPITSVNIETAPFLPLSGDEYEQEIKFKESLRGYDFEYMMEHCALIQNIENTTHEELFHLACNLACIRGGQDAFARIAEKRPYNRSIRGENYYQKLVRILARKRYRPTQCSDYCPYLETAKCGKPQNLLRLSKRKLRQVVRTEDFELKTVTMEESRSLLKNTYETILKENDSKIHLIIAPGGAGKTHAINETPFPDGKGIIITKTHDNASLISNQGKKFPKKSQDHAERLELGYKHGAHLKATINLREMAKSPAPSMQKFKEDYESYLDETKQAKESPIKRVTLARFLLNPTSFSNSGGPIVIDENPLPRLLYIGSVPEALVQKYFAEFNPFQDAGDDYELYEQMVNHKQLIEGLEEGIVRKTESLSDQYRKNLSKWQENVFEKANELSLAMSLSTVTDSDREFLQAQIPPEGNLTELLSADYILKENGRYYFLKKNLLLEDTKTIIMSATADPIIMHEHFGQELVIHDLGHLKPKGRLVQYTGKSFSKTSLLGNDNSTRQTALNIIEYYRDKGYAVISFKGMSKYTDLDMYFYNVESRRELEGRNLLVIGTPNPTIPFLKLNAAAFERDPTEITGYTKAKFQTIMAYGFEFDYKMPTDDPFMRRFLLEYVRENLMQAIYRNRFYEYDCNLVLCSNFPIAICEVHNGLPPLK